MCSSDLKGHAPEEKGGVTEKEGERDAGDPDGSEEMRRDPGKQSDEGQKKETWKRKPNGCEMELVPQDETRGEEEDRGCDRS